MNDSMPSAEFTEAEVVSSSPLEGDATLSVVGFKADVAKFDVNASEVRAGIKMLAALSITDAQSREAAYQLTKSASKSLKLIEAKLKEICEPYKRRIADLKAHADTFLTGPLEKAIREQGDAKILAYDKAEQARRAEENRKLEAERLRLEQEAAAKAQEIADKAKAELSAVVNSGDFVARQQAIDAMPPGVMRAKAQRDLRADLLAAQDKVLKGADQATVEVAIDTSLAKSDIRGKLEENAEAVKGTMKVTKWEVTDESLVHRNFMEVSDKKVNAAIKAGAKAMPGIRIWMEDRLRH